MQSTKKESESLSTKEYIIKSIELAADQKARDLRAIDIAEISSICDYFVIASGTSETHVKGIADKIKAGLSKHGLKCTYNEGYENADWIIIDYSDFMVHLFYEPTRQYYEFDKLWSKGAELELPDELEKELSLLRTGMY